MEAQDEDAVLVMPPPWPLRDRILLPSGQQKRNPCPPVFPKVAKNSPNAPTKISVQKTCGKRTAEFEHFANVHIFAKIEDVIITRIMRSILRQGFHLVEL